LRRQTVWAAARSRVKGRWPKPQVARALRLYPVEDASPFSAVGIANAALAAGNIVVWFPEGWRSGDGQLLPFQPGIGHVLLAADVPVLPVYIGGTFEAWPRTQRLPRFRPVSVTFGRPLLRQDLLAGEANPFNPAQRIAEALRAQLIEVARQTGAGVA
jgi:long-chain acyl-CoA synthetase